MLAIKRSRMLLFVLPCGVLAAAFTLSAAPPEDSKAEPLLQKRLEVLAQVAALQREAFQRGEANSDAVLLAQDELLEAELELTADRAARIVIYERFVEAAAGVEKLVGQQYDAGEATLVDVLKTKAAHLKAQADLLSEQAKP